MYFINLTHGLNHPKAHLVKDFIRIQSTWCEQKQWSRIVEDLDYSFLIALAKGEHITILDCSSHKPVSRACFQGIEWIRYILNKEWAGVRGRATVRGHNVTDYFESIKLSGFAKQKIKYCKKWHYGGLINIDYDCCQIKENY